MNSTADDAVFINLNFIGVSKCDEFIFDDDAQSRKFISSSVGPLKSNFFETFIATSFSDIFLDIGHFSADSSINSVGGNQDAPLEIEGFAQLFLPKTHCLGICNGGKSVVQNHLIELRRMLVHVLILDRLRRSSNFLHEQACALNEMGC